MMLSRIMERRPNWPAWRWLRLHFYLLERAAREAQKETNDPDKPPG